jgi:ribosomal protein S18 acetylase RimI-like enzyme
LIPVVVRPLGDGDRPWLRGLIERLWGLPVVTPSGIYDRPDRLDGYVADVDGATAGAATYRVTGDSDLEVVTLNAAIEGHGVGRALLDAVRDQAAIAGADRVWLITTSDNPGAIGFYEHIGMRRVRTWKRFDRIVRADKPTLPAALVFDALEYEWAAG